MGLKISPDLVTYIAYLVGLFRKSERTLMRCTYIRTQQTNDTKKKTINIQNLVVWDKLPLLLRQFQVCCFLCASLHNISAVNQTMPLMTSLILVDYCDPDPCLGNGICIRQTNGYTCSCDVGYAGADCETGTCT